MLGGFDLLIRQHRCVHNSIFGLVVIVLDEVPVLIRLQLLPDDGHGVRAGRVHQIEALDDIVHPHEALFLLNFGLLLEQVAELEERVDSGKVLLGPLNAMNVHQQLVDGALDVDNARLHQLDGVRGVDDVLVTAVVCQRERVKLHGFAFFV